MPASNQSTVIHRSAADQPPRPLTLFAAAGSGYTLVMPPIGHGAHASVHGIAEHDAIAAKVYHQHIQQRPKREREIRVRRLSSLIHMGPPAMPPDVHLAWPTELLSYQPPEHDERPTDAYLMPRAPANCRSIRHIIDEEPGSHRAQEVADLLRRAINRLHDQNFVGGDVNGYNAAITDDLQLWLFDVDSWQFTDQGDRLHYATGYTSRYTHPQVLAATNGARRNCADRNCPLGSIIHPITRNCNPRRPDHDRYALNKLARELCYRSPTG